MRSLNLTHTAALMSAGAKNEDFDSYAVWVKCADSETTLFSDNVDEDTYFDVASVGKVLITAPLALQAVSGGRLSLDGTLGAYFDNVPDDKKSITIRQILSHTSGIGTRLISQEAAKSGHDAVTADILSDPLVFAPGTGYRYSDLGMMLMGFLLEKVYGKPLEMLFEKRLKAPLGYTRSTFNITADTPNAAVCYRAQMPADPLHPWDDPNIQTLQTAAGNGGQFFTLADMKKYAYAVLDKDERLYPKEMFALAESVQSPPCASETRGLGWLIVDEKYPQTGNLFPNGGFGHTGHTGQSIFFDRKRDLCIIVLTNATRFLNRRSGFKGYDYREIMKLREAIHNAAAEDLAAARRQ